MPSEPSSRATADPELIRRVRVSLGAPSADSLVGRLDWIAELGCVAELRLDLLPEGVDLRALQRRHPGLDLVAAWPWLGTSGASRPEDLTRIEALREAAAAGLPWIDVPSELAEADLPSVRRVWSWHGETASIDAARAAREQLQARAGAEDVLKLVTRAEFAEEALPILDLYRESGASQLLAFAMGLGGEATRQLCLRAGAPWTYAAWGKTATAAGQQEVHALLEELPMTQDGPLYGVVGDPVAHSRSPQLWADALRSVDRAAWFGRFRARDFSNFFAAAERIGVEALAITAPFKTDALQHADVLGESSAVAGSVNLLQRVDGRWMGDITDGVGAMNVLKDSGLERSGEVLILGAGGAARATAAEALRRGHPTRLVARDLAKAEQATEDILQARSALPWAEELPPASLRAGKLDAADLDADAVVQATPVGSRATPGNLIDGGSLRPGSIALDMVYEPIKTEFQRTAFNCGARPLDGRWMLASQMTEQFQQVVGEQLCDIDMMEVLHRSTRHPGIVLIGARGSGKTTLGRWLAEVLDLGFLDADEEYAARHGESVEQALASDVESFRKRESELLDELTQDTAANHGVLATGGGFVDGPHANHVTRCRVYWLESTAEVLTERQAEAPRPRLRPGGLLEETRTLLAEREERYSTLAHARVRTDGTLAEAQSALRASILRNLAVSFCYS